MAHHDNTAISCLWNCRCSSKRQSEWIHLWYLCPLCPLVLYIQVVASTARDIEYSLYSQCLSCARDGPAETQLEPINMTSITDDMSRYHINYCGCYFNVSVKQLKRNCHCKEKQTYPTKLYNDTTFHGSKCLIVQYVNNYARFCDIWIILYLESPQPISIHVRLWHRFVIICYSFFHPSIPMLD